MAVLYIRYSKLECDFFISFFSLWCSLHSASILLVIHGFLRGYTYYISMGNKVNNLIVIACFKKKLVEKYKLMDSLNKVTDITLLKNAVVLCIITVSLLGLQFLTQVKF